MGKPVIYIDPQKAQELDQIIAKQTPTINIDPQKAHDLNWHLALQKLYYIIVLKVCIKILRD